MPQECIYGGTAPIKRKTGGNNGAFNPSQQNDCNQCDKGVTKYILQECNNLQIQISFSAREHASMVKETTFNYIKC